MQTTVTPKVCSICNHATGESSTSTQDLGFGSHTYNNNAFVDYDQNQHIKYCDNYAACQSVNPGGYVLENHTYDENNYTMVRKETCQQTGLYTTPCLICGHVKPQEVDKLPHDDGLDAYGNGSNPVYKYKIHNGFENGHRWTQCSMCNRIVIDEYLVTVTKDGTINSVTGGGYYSSGHSDPPYNASRPQATVAISAKPNIGHHFTNWTSPYASSLRGLNPNANQTSFAMPSGAISVQANGAINISTLVVNPAFKTNSYKASCDAYWEGSSDTQSFGPENWHTTKDIPLPTRTGYDFAGWTLTSDHPNDGPGTMSTLTGPAVFTYGSDWAPVSTDTLTANWTPRTDTKYVIRHWKQNLDYSLGDDKNKYDTIMDDYEKYYTLDETENLQGESDKVLVFKEIARNYPGFHFVGGEANVNDGPFIQVAQAKIHPDGITEINLFYARNRYTVSTSHDGSGEVYSESEGRGGYDKKKKGSNWFQYGDDVTVSYELYDGWYTDHITVDGVKIEKNDLRPYWRSYKFDDLVADHKVDVIFKIMPHINIVSKYEGDTDEVKQWNPIFIYHIEGTDYLGRHAGYNYATEKWDEVLDEQILPGEYTVTSEPVDRWKIRNASVDQFQVGEMSKDFAITVNLIDREDPANGTKAPTSLFTYVYGVDHWNGFSSSDIVVNKLRMKK